MASISMYVTKQGPRYRARFTNSEGIRTDRRGFRTEDSAASFLATLRAARDERIDSGAPLHTIASLGELWLNAQIQLKPSSFAVILSCWKVHVQPFWGHRKIHEIGHIEIQSWISDLSRTRSPSVVIRARGVLSGIFALAMREGVMTKNPATGINLPRKHPKPRAYLDHTQVEILATEAGQHALLIYVLAYTGMRWGEAVALRVRNVRPATSRIVVAASTVNVHGHLIEGAPKNHHVRTVPVPSFIMQELAERCRTRSAASTVFGDGVRYLPTPTHSDGWFANARRRAIARADSIPETLTLHDLRHTAASLAVSAGANVKAVQRMLGHASAAMTLDTYADLFEDDLDSVAVDLESARRRALSDRNWCP